jgi:hypothetical protein
VHSVAPRHVPPHNQKLPDFGIFHIINAGGSNSDKVGGKLLASPLTSSYGTTVSSSAGAATRTLEPPRWTHGGDLFQDPLRYDSDENAGPSPRQFPDSFNSDHSSAATSYERRSLIPASFPPV